MLNQNIFSNTNKLRKLLEQPVVIIDDALDSEVAEELYKQLLKSDAWTKQEIDENKSLEYLDDFYFKRDQIDINYSGAPAIVKDLYNYLNSKEIRQLFSDISGTCCDSFRASATIFNKGDQISEHNDLYVYDEPGKPKSKRVLTFNYYLTKHWDPKWGGNLIWNNPRSSISPKFNSLVLFNVTTNSSHWVEPVLIEPESKRLSITGWYLEEIKKEKFKLSL